MCAKRKKERKKERKTNDREKKRDARNKLSDVQLLPTVAAMGHQRAYETLHDGALSLAESLDLVATRGVGDVHGKAVLHGDVVLKGNIGDLHRLDGPVCANVCACVCL